MRLRLCIGPNAFGNAIASSMVGAMQSSESPANAMPTRANDVQSVSSAGRVPIEAASFGGSSFLGDGFGGADFEWGGGKSGYGMSSGPAGVDLGLQGVGTLVAGSELPDPSRANSYPKVFGDGQAVTVLDAASGQRIACWRTAETCILPPMSASASSQAMSDQLVWESGLANSTALTELASQSAPIALRTEVFQNPIQFALERSINSGGQSAMSLVDTQQRMTYHAANEAASNAALDRILQADLERNPTKGVDAAYNASQQRIDNRNVARQGLSRGGLRLSQAVDQTFPPEFYFNKYRTSAPGAGDLNTATSVAR